MEPVKHWLNLCGEPALRDRITRTLEDAGHSVIVETDPEVLATLSTLDAVVIDHNTTKPLAMFAGAFRESGLLVVFVGANRGNRDGMNFAAGMLGFYRCSAYEFPEKFGKDGTYVPENRLPVTAAGFVPRVLSL